jgi:citrate lyase subunit beta/citryl-CoA lyase
VNAPVARLWRSLLFVPANVDRFFDKARSSGADAIQLDLEDAVAPNEKAAARRAVAAAAERVSGGAADVIVRINRPLTLALEDIAASVGPHVYALTLPKIMGADHIRLLGEAVAEAEVRAGIAVGTTRFIVMVETAEAALRAREIAMADPRVIGMTLGSEDLATDLGVEPVADVLETYHALLVAAAVAARIAPLGLVGSIAEFRDLDAFARVVRRSRAFGYRGASCIHPAQIPVINAAFTPSRAEVERASTIVAAYDAAHARGEGAIELDGRMIDVPIAERARALLATYEATLAHGRR